MRRVTVGAWGAFGAVAVVGATVLGLVTSGWLPLGSAEGRGRAEPVAGGAGALAGCEASIPYTSGVGGYASYRIPAVVRTRAGTVLAFAEGRVGTAGDSGDIDLVVRRSEDGGCTWGPLRVAAEGHGDTYPSDGGASLDRPFAPQPALDRVPVVQGGLLYVDGPGGTLLFSAPSVPSARVEPALWSSGDGGRTFTKTLTASLRKAAYSDLVRLDAGTIGLLHETGTKSAYETVEFRRIPWATATGSARQPS